MKRGLTLLLALPVLLAAEGDVPELILPVGCTIGQSCYIQHYVDIDPSPGARDYRCGSARTYDKHDGIDFRLRSMVQQRAGVPVFAAADGTVANVRDGMRDISVAIAGKASVAGKECGNGVVVRHGRGVETQYCHLARGSVRVKPGETVSAGSVLGLVGMSGNAEFPHLHFMVRKGGKVIDPFAYGAGPGHCAGGRNLWKDPAEFGLSYKAGEVINAGFATGPLTMDGVQDHGDNQQPRPTRNAPLLVAFVQVIGLESGDYQLLNVTAPDGSTLAENRAPPLDRNKAQWLIFAGKKRQASAWPTGRYTARYQLIRKGKAVIDRRFGITLD